MTKKRDKCLVCGTTILGLDDTVCKECGKPLYNVCEECGMVNDDNASSCKACSAKTAFLMAGIIGASGNFINDPKF